MLAHRRGALLLLLGASGLHAATAEATAALNEFEAAADDICEAGDDECAVSLRQLRKTVLDGHEAAKLETPAVAGVNEPANASKVTTEHSNEAAALEHRATMFGPGGHLSNLMQTFTNKGSVQLYHQTSADVAGLIMRDGFRPGSAGWCGGAIYFATTPKATFTKAIGTQSHTGVILQASVSLGRVCQMGSHCDMSMSGAKLRSMGCDSIRFNPGDGDELVVYDPRRVGAVKVAWADQKSMKAMGLSGDMAMDAELGAEMDAEMQSYNAAAGLAQPGK